MYRFLKSLFPLIVLFSFSLSACSGIETSSLIGRSDLPAPDTTFSHTIFALYKGQAGDDKNEKNQSTSSHYDTGAKLAQADYVRGELAQNQTITVYDGAGYPHIFTNMDKVEFTQGLTKQYTTKVSKVFSVGRKEVSIIVRLKQQPNTVNAINGKVATYYLQTMYLCPLDVVVKEVRDWETVNVAYDDCINQGTLLTDGWELVRLFGFDNVGMTFGIEGDIYAKAELPVDWWERNDVHVFQAVGGVMGYIQSKLPSSGGWLTQDNIVDLQKNLMEKYGARLYLLSGDAQRFTFSSTLMGREAPIITCTFLDVETAKSDCFLVSVYYDAKFNNFDKHMQAFYHFSAADLFGEDGKLKDGVNPNDERFLAYEHNGWMNSPIPHVAGFALHRYNFSSQTWEPVVRADIKAFAGANRTTLFLHKNPDFLFDPEKMRGEIGEYGVPEQNCDQNISGNADCYRQDWWNEIWLEKALLKAAYREVNDDPNLLATAQIYFNNNSQYEFVCDTEDEKGKCTSGHYKIKNTDLTAEYFLGNSEETDAWIDFVAFFGEQYARRTGWWFMKDVSDGNGSASAIGFNWAILHPDDPFAATALELGGVIQYPAFLRHNQFLYPEQELEIDQ